MADHFVTVPDSLELPAAVLVPIARLSDAGTAGRAVLDAETAADARTAIGAGTSSLTVGTGAGDAKAGNYQPTAANISDSTPAGIALITAADAAAQVGALGLADHATRGAAPSRTVNTPGAGVTYRRLHIDEQGRIYRGKAGNALEVSTDNGATWAQIGAGFPTPPGAAITVDDGEILVATADNYPANTIKARLWRSTGYAPGGAVTWTQVLEADDYQQAFGTGWQFGGAGGIYTVSEYDSKAPGARSATQRVWLTEDNGATWAPIYNHGNGALSSRHVHGSSYDPWRDAIWITLGDYTGSETGDRRIIVSWDRGTTWATVTTQHQPTVVQPMPQCVIFGTDNAPNGILRIDNPSPSSLVVKLAYPLSKSTVLSHVAQHKFQRPGAGHPLLVSFVATTTGQRSVVMATYDGIAWWELWGDSRTYTGTNKGAQSAVGPDDLGVVEITGVDDAGTFRDALAFDSRSAIAALSRAASHAIRAMPRVSVITMTNQSSPFQTITAYTPAELLMNPAPNLLDNPSDLFVPASNGVTVTRDALCEIRGALPLSGGLMGKACELDVMVDGVARFSCGDAAIAATVKVTAGQRISLRGNVSVTNTLISVTRCLTVAATETY